MTMEKPTVQLSVLTWPVYQQLEKQVTRPIISSTTTPEQVAFALGVQHVLEVLRNGFTVTR